MRGLAFLLLFPLLSVPALAEAQRSPFRGRVSAGAGAMVSSDQRSWLALDGVALAGALTVGYEVVGPVSAEGRIAGSYFLSDRRTDGALAELGLGARVFLWTTSWWRLETAAHVSAGWTGPLVRPTIDLSLAGSFAVSDEVALGPEVTYGQVFWTNGEGYSTDARFLVASIAVTFSPVSSPPVRERARTVERTRVVRTIEREVLLEPVAARPPDPAALDRLLDRALPVTRREEVVLIPPILFAFDSTRILPEGEVALHAARDLIARMPDDIAIEGHADGRGTDEYNANLSLARAMWVRDWLVARGIDGNRLSIEAHGEHRPLEDETDDWTRQLSRRVTFRAVRLSEGASGASE